VGAEFGGGGTFFAFTLESTKRRYIFLRYFSLTTKKTFKRRSFFLIKAALHEVKEHLQTGVHSLMFYEQLEAILDGEASNGWEGTARRLHVTGDQLRRKIARRTLTVDEGLNLVRESESPELLAWALKQLRPKVMNSINKPN